MSTALEVTLGFKSHQYENLFSPNIKLKCSSFPASSYSPWLLICPTLKYLYSSTGFSHFKFPELLNHYSTKPYLMSSLNLSLTALLVICIAISWAPQFVNAFLVVTV